MPTIAHKLLNRDTLAKALADYREKGRIIVFTNGCFDLLHVGHVRYLQAARKEGDVLVVGVNSDASMRRIKGTKRPIVPEDQRAEVIGALSCVDIVTLFDEPDPGALITALKPDVLVKGADWNMESIIGAETVQKNGGRVVRVELTPDASTSRIIETILYRYAVDPMDAK